MAKVTISLMQAATTGPEKQIGSWDVPLTGAVLEQTLDLTALQIAAIDDWSVLYLSITGDAVVSVAEVWLEGAQGIFGVIRANPGERDLVLSGLAPIVSAGLSLPIGAGALTLSGQSVSLFVQIAVASSAGAIALTGLQPTRFVQVYTQPSAGALAFTGQATNRFSQQYVTPAGVGLALSGLAPMRLVQATIAVATGALVVEGLAPVSLAASGLAPDTAALTLSGESLVAQVSAYCAPAAGELAIGGLAPGVTGQSAIPVTEGQLAIAGQAPTRLVQVYQQPAVGSLAFTGQSLTLALGVGVPGSARATDDFNRASLGANWTVANGSATIFSNQLQCSGSSVKLFWSGSPVGPDQFSEFKNLSSGNWRGIAARCSGTGTNFVGYCIFVARTDGIAGSSRFGYISGSGFGEYLDVGTNNVTVNPGDRIRFEVEGQDTNIVLRFYINGNLTRSLTYAEFTPNKRVLNSGAPGLYNYTGTNLFDDFVGGSLVGGLALQGVAPAISTGIGRAPASSGLAFSGLAPSLFQQISVSPAAAQLTLSGLAPSVLGEGAVGVGTGDLAFSGQAANLQLAFSLSPAASALAFTGQAPTLQRQFVLQPDAGALAVTGQAVSLAGLFSYAPDAAVLVVSGQAPTLTTALRVQPAAGQLAFSGNAPTLQSELYLLADLAAMVLVSPRPHLGFAILMPDEP